MQVNTVTKTSVIEHGEWVTGVKYYFKMNSKIIIHEVMFCFSIETGCIIKCSIEKWSESVFVGIDKLLAQHIAHLFIRDPLSLFEEKIHLDDENESDHFEVKMIPTLYWLTVAALLLKTKPLLMTDFKRRNFSLYNQNVFSMSRLSCRICSQPTGRQWGSNLLLQTRTSDGELSSAPWR